MTPEYHRRHLGAPDGAHAHPPHRQLVEVDLRLLAEPVVDGPAGLVEPVLGDKDLPHGRAVLAGPVEQEDGDPPTQEDVAVEGDTDLLGAVHAADGDDARHLVAGPVGRGQVQPAGQRLALVGDLGLAGDMVGVLGVLAVAVVLAPLELLVLPGVLRDRPLGLAVEDGGDVEALPRAHRVPVPLHLLAPVLAEGGRVGVLPGDVVVLLDALLDPKEVAQGGDPAWEEGEVDVALVPGDPARLDDAVEDPPLLPEPPDTVLDFLGHRRHGCLLLLSRVRRATSLRGLPSGSAARRHPRPPRCR